MVANYSDFIFEYSEKRELLDVTFADFDGVLFHVGTPIPEQKNIVQISLRWSCAQQLLQLGGREDLKKTYGPMLLAQPVANYDVSLQVDLNTPPEDPSKYFLFYLKSIILSVFNYAN